MEIKKILLGLFFSVFVLSSNISAFTSVGDFDGYKEKIKHDWNTGEMIIYGNNNNGRFGISKSIKKVSETDAINVSEKIKRKNIILKQRS